MRLLVDSDVFCKLGVAGLLADALAVLGVSLDECGRLPALPYMLRRGKLPRTYGAAECDQLVQVAQGINAIPAPDVHWLDRLAAVQDVDPGEAQLLAVAAENSLLLMTGDKCAIRAIGSIEGYAEALRQRVVVLEAILIALCGRLGEEEVRGKVDVLRTNDHVVGVCFSPDNPDPGEALRSYFQSLTNEVHPLLLWEPLGGGTA